MFRFCRSKCHKNFKAKRNPRKVRWTKAYRRTHGKELITDPVFEFEKHKDTAIKYDRNVWIDTVQAMEKLDKIRTERESRFWEQRMKDSQHHKKEMIKSNLIRNETLIADPQIRQKVEKLKEERDQKRTERRMSRNKKKNEDLNVGLETENDVNMEPVEKIKKEKAPMTKKKKQKLAQKQKLINRKKHIRQSEVEVE